MADNVISTAAFGQKKDSDQEEEPIIIAQRFLNIFRQLHIFSQERKDEFNRMILEQPKSVKKCLKTLPGGSVLLEYIDELQYGKQSDDDDDDDDIAPAPSIDVPAPVENTSTGAMPAPAPVAGAPIINGDNFAKILANSLAQSNAQIIRELQNDRSKKGSDKDDHGQLKLVADDTFTQTISAALAEALAASEQKRQEDNCCGSDQQPQGITCMKDTFDLWSQQSTTRRCLCCLTPIRIWYLIWKYVVSHLHVLVWLLAVVSLPCTFGDFHIGEYGCKG